jgi:hypothetical protein
MRGRPLPRCLLVSLTLIATVFGAGCGGGKSDKQRINDTFTRLTRAIDARQGAAACRLFTPEGRRAFERYQNAAFRDQPPKSCEQIAGELTSVGSRLGDLQIRGKAASAKLLDADRRPVASGRPIAFRKVGGDWKIDKFGPFGVAT